ncbi:MAG: VWA domain-containing protein [Microthrixaceae bacterium]
MSVPATSSSHDSGSTSHATPRHHRRRRSIAIAAVLGLFAMVLSYLPMASVSATPSTDGNPDLPQKCGLDMTIIIDRSGSIDGYNDQVANAANALIDGVSNTGSKVQVISFSSRATAVTLSNGTIGSSSAIGDLALHDAEDVNLTKYTSNGGTNWDDALEMARRSGNFTPLTVILTDGNPTYANGGFGVNGHGNSLVGNGWDTTSTEVNKAVAEADLLKAAGTHMLAVGIGNNIDTGNLSAISGDDQLTATNGMSFAEADYTTVNFDTLKSLLEDFVKELCAPSLNITKTEIPLQGAERPGNGWDFTVDLASTPTEWESPAGTTGASATETTVAGKANFKWEQGNTTMGASVTETAKPGWKFSSATCERRNYDTGAVSQLTLSPQTAGDGSVTWVLPGGLGPSDSVNCNVRNREVAPGRIDVRKVTTPANMPGEFDFELTGPGTQRDLDDLSHGETETFGTVSPGTYSVTEASTPNFTLAAATCDNVGTQGIETANPASLVVGEGENWLCTFKNAAANGSITVKKVTQGADGTFGFTSNFAGNFSLATSGGQARTSATSVAPGTYSVTEQDAAPWTLESAVCSDGSPIGAITVNPGENVTCTFTNVAPAPSLEVTKTASVDSVSEPGATVTYTVGIKNTSVESLTIDSVSDVVGTGAPIDVTKLPGNTCDDLIGTTLAAGASTSCTFNLFVGGDAGDVVNDTVTVDAHDSDDTEVTDSADESVTVNDVDPAVTVVKTAGTLSVTEPGADVEFTVEVTNDSVEPITVDSLTDSIAGGPQIDISSTGSVVKATTCGSVVGATIAPSGSLTCKFTVAVEGQGDTSVTDVVTVGASDDDGNDVGDTDAATVDVIDVLPGVTITKTASVDTLAEPGGNVTFSFLIENTSAQPVTIESLDDTVFGDLFEIEACEGLDGAVLAPSDGTPGSGADSTLCQITKPLIGDAGDQHKNTATVVVADDDGNTAQYSDDATVDFTDVLPTISVDKDASAGSVDEPGEVVTFTATMTNHSVEPVTITGVTDAVGGGTPFDVTSVAGPVLATTCGTAVGTVVAPSSSYSCTFDVFVAGNAGATIGDQVRFTATDDEGNTAEDHDDETVDVDDTTPGIDVVKEASVSEVSEPGADVEFTFEITNTSVEDLTITSVTDSVFGDITNECGLEGVVLAPNGTSTCKITRFVGGNAGDVHENTATVKGTDDDGNEASGTDDEDVDVTDVPPTIEVTKDDRDASVDAPGGVVTYSVDITNTSVEPVTVTSITDTVDEGEAIDVTVVADPISATTCELGVSIAPSDTYSCTFDIAVVGDGSSAVFDVVSATVTDDEGNEGTDTDDEDTPVDPVADLSVAKSANVEEINSGDQVTYTLTVSNAGPSTATDVTLTDELPEGLSVVSVEGDDDHEWDCEASTGTVVACELLALPVDDTATVVVVASVEADPGTITNTVVVDSETSDPDEENNTADEDVDVVEEPVATTTTVPVEVLRSTDSTPAPAPAPAATPAPSTQSAPLAFTGGSTLWMALGAMAVLLVGLGLVLVSRRRGATG